jgi:hypothetical protein
MRMPIQIMNGFQTFRWLFRPNVRDFCLVRFSSGRLERSDWKKLPITANDSMWCATFKNFTISNSETSSDSASENDRFNGRAHKRFFNWRRLDRTLSISSVRERPLNSQFTLCITIFLWEWTAGDLGELSWFIRGCKFTDLGETRCYRKSSKWHRGSQFTDSFTALHRPWNRWVPGYWRTVFPIFSRGWYLGCSAEV